MTSEISLIHPDDINWFLTCDETHHAFSNEGHKGRSTALRYSTSSFHRSGERCVASNSHTTGVYGTTGAGYPMPCMFVMSSNAKEAKDFQIDPAVCVGLPVVRAKYADNVLSSDYLSHVAIRHSGSVDTYLWHELNRAVYIPCFAGKIPVEPVHDLGKIEFNAELLDLEPNHVENHVLPANKEEAIQALMKNGGVNKAGSLFRVGISVVNWRVVLETLWRTKERQEKEKEEKERAQKVAEDGKLNSGLEAFGK